MTLFDADQYGQARPKQTRTRRQRPDMVRLQPPWVLIGQAGKTPVAHTLSRRANDFANKDGAVLTACDRRGYIIPVDGNPLAPVCTRCFDDLI